MIAIVPITTALKATFLLQRVAIVSCPANLSPASSIVLSISLVTTNKAIIVAGTKKVYTV